MFCSELKDIDNDHDNEEEDAAANDEFVVDDDFVDGKGKGAPKIMIMIKIMIRLMRMLLQMMILLMMMMMMMILLIGKERVHQMQMVKNIPINHPSTGASRSQSTLWSIFSKREKIFFRKKNNTK